MVGKIFRKMRPLLGPRLLKSSFRSAKGTTASALFNDIISARQLQGSYLEIGVEYGFTLEAVKLDTKYAVDPNPKFNSVFKPKNTKVFKNTSDLYFHSLPPEVKFDLVYIDGLHTFQQTFKDLLNVLNHLNERAVVVIDDTVPSDSYSALPDPMQAYSAREAAGAPNDFSWHGDVFKLVSILDNSKSLAFRLATIYDLDNPKTVLWCDSSKSWGENVFPSSNLEIQKLQYGDVFDKGIPSFFKPMTKSEIIKELTIK